ncbi:MAG: response regulator [Lachnospiraceae bacterium]
MMKILICDDEGIVRESLMFILQKNFPGEYEAETARNGRIAIELAESFRPDIIMMDIQMPGINGIEAMREIRKENRNVVFIILTAYDKFEYSQTAIDLGVFSYLTKPINKDKFCEVLKQAMHQVVDRKKKVSSDLRVKEKLEAVIPIIAGGFVYSTIFEHRFGNQDNSEYRELLGISENYGYIVVIECGDELHQGIFSNKVGAGIKLKKDIPVFRETVREAISGIIGEVMANKVVAVVPSKSAAEDYDERVAKIEKMRTLMRKLEQQIGLKFKAGIGTVRGWDDMAESYREASEAVGQRVGKVIHAEDVPNCCIYEESYPIDLEKKMFSAIAQGDTEKTQHYSEEYMQWMESSRLQADNTVRLKVIEFVLWAEHLAYEHGGMVYHFDGRADYLDTLMSLDTYKAINFWFVQKMKEAARHIAANQREKSNNAVEKAKAYITENFTSDLSLENLAKEIGISPYYLSRLFKELEGINYIDYLTALRMDYAKKELSESEKSIKEICRDAGYSDPNYFSRIFKKWVGFTPTEFREKGVSR